MDELTNYLSNMYMTENNMNEELDNLSNDMCNLNINKTENFGKIEWWKCGIRNYRCSTIDDEDFAYRTLSLPNSIFTELINSEMTSYIDYFDAFCCNNEELFYTNNIIFKTAELFDNIFAKRLINFDTVGQLMTEANQQLLYLINETSELYNYFTFNDYIQDLITGLFILMDMLKYYSDNFQSNNYHFMISLLNNYCVIVIYLKFYFESTSILKHNDKIIIR
jgi:hypothetical protein